MRSEPLSTLSLDSRGGACHSGTRGVHPAEQARGDFERVIDPTTGLLVCFLLPLAPASGAMTLPEGLRRLFRLGGEESEARGTRRRKRAAKRALAAALSSATPPGAPATHPATCDASRR